MHEFPDDVLHLVFSYLTFRDKVTAGLVCKRWDEALRGKLLGHNHWDVHYNLDNLVSVTMSMTQPQQSSSLHPLKKAGRWFARRADAVKRVRLSATISSGQQGNSTLKVLERELPLLAGSLSRGIVQLDLEFYEGSPLQSPLLSSPSFLALLCPMVKSLKLCHMHSIISPEHFAALCELSCLEELSIMGSGEEEQEGLRELTPDIGKLKNLRSLILAANDAIESIPDAISCLSKLEHLKIDMSPVSELPSGLTSLENLSSLRISWNGPVGPAFPTNLQGLRSLATIALCDCCLPSVPSEFSALSALTSLDVSGNTFESTAVWWPPTLSRLTQLQELIACDCQIVDLPLHMSGLSSLQRLDLSMNSLTHLPQHVSSLIGLRALMMQGNRLSTFPVSVLLRMTAIQDIELVNQERHPSWRREDQGFRISEPLHPILHPKLKTLDLRQPLNFKWDATSLFHLGRAMAEICSRDPMPTLLF
eukprot:jgi/Botrbrau1/10019/Bobra.0012s0106.1